MIRNLKDLPRIGDVHAARIALVLGGGDEYLALKKIEENPYCLLEVPRIGFKTADTIATETYGVPKESPERHRQGNRFILGEDGTLTVDEFDHQRRKLDLLAYTHRRLDVVEESGRVWLPEVLEAEQNFAGWVRQLPLNEAPALGGVQMTEELDTLLMELDQQQRIGALLALKGRNTQVMALTGGAGTGKTHVIGGICRVAQIEGQSVAVAAFAGKAADRIRSSLSKASTSATYAGTIHKMLGYTGYQFSEGVLHYDLIILDEASMIPTMLLWQVVKRLKPGARLLLVGDPGQLPPVGYGQPFSDLLTLGLPEHHLEINYRSQHVQGIIRTAQSIRNFSTLKNPGDESFKLSVGRDLAEEATELIRDIAARQPLDDWQLLTWKNEDAQAFNLAIQEEVNPDGFPLFYYRPFGGSYIQVKAGDKVMVRANAYDLDVFNGQLGIARGTKEVVSKTTRPAETLEDFAQSDENGNVVTEHRTLCVEVMINNVARYIPLAEAHELLQLGYAVTVHKAQGSDWEEVVIYQPRSVAFDANRWWYTCVTRAKTCCHVLYEAKVKGGDGKPLWWANTRKTVELGPSIFVGRVRKMRLQQPRLMADARSAEEIGKELLGQ